MIEVTLFMEPHAKGRPRCARGGRAYTPKTTREWEEKASKAIASIAEARFEGPVAVTVEAYYRLPKIHCNNPPSPMQYAVGRAALSDLDNIFKACLDAGNKLLYEDDNQVAALAGCKLMAAQGEPSTVVICVAPAPSPTTIVHRVRKFLRG